MKRSVGVTVSAILVLVGSLLWLAISLLTVSTLARRLASMPVPMRYATVGVAWFLVVCSVLGCLTAIGLFRLRRWARISLLAFAFLLTYTAGFSTVSMTLFPLVTRQPLSPHTELLARLVMIGCFSLPVLAIGSWWLYLFNQPSVRAQFAQPITTSQRPASMTVIGVLLIVGGLMAWACPLIRMPATFFGLLFTGWVGTLILLVQGMLALTLGIGLLRLQELARRCTIGYLVYGVLNISLFVLLPGSGERWDAIQAIFLSQIQHETLSTGRLMFSMLAHPTVLCLVQLWFLIGCRHAFVPSQHTPQVVS